MTTRSEDIEALIAAFHAYGWRELSVEVDGLRLVLGTEHGAERGATASAPRPHHATEPVSTAAIATPAARSPTPIEAPAASWSAVRAPNLGTFYRSPKPGAAPFVEIGDAVGQHTEMCLLEVMKLFTSVTAGVAGTVRQICVADAELVEGGQILFYIEPK